MAVQHREQNPRPSRRIYSSTAAPPPSQGTRTGNHPYAARSISNSFPPPAPAPRLRPTRTSTSSASSASHCCCAPSVPGPRDEILPAEETTRCQGTAGSADGERNLRAVVVMGTWMHARCGTVRHDTMWDVASARRVREGRRGRRGSGKKGLGLALSDVARVSGHPDELCYVACS